MNEAATSSKSAFDSFRFNKLVPSLQSRIQERVIEPFVEEISDGEDSMDTGGAHPPQSLGEGAKLYARIFMKGNDFDHIKVMDTQAETQQDPEDNAMTTDDMEENTISASNAKAQVFERTGSQSIADFTSASPTFTEDQIASPVPDNDFTRSPTLVEELRGAQPNVDSEESNVCKLEKICVSEETEKNITGQAMELDVSDVIAPIALTSPTKQGASYADWLTSADIGSRAPHVAEPSLVNIAHGSLSGDHASYNPTLLDTPSTHAHDIPPTMTSAHLALQSTQDPFKRIFDSVFDEATAAWEEEARLKEATRSFVISVIARPADQEPPAQKTHPDTALAASSSSATTCHSSQSPEELYDNLSKTKQNHFVMDDNHYNLQRSISPHGQTSAALLGDAPVVLTSPDAISRMDSSQHSTPAGATTVSRQIADDQDNAPMEVGDLQFVDAVAEAVYQSLTISEADEKLTSTVTQAQSSGSLAADVNNHVPSGPSLRATAHSTKAVSRGVALDFAQPSCQAVARTPIAILATDPHPYSRQDEVLIPSPVLSILASSIEDAYKSQDDRPAEVLQDITDHPMEANIYPPSTTTLEGSSVSRPLKRRLSSSTVVTKEEDLDSCTQTCLSSNRPLKMKKIEDEDEDRKPLRAELKKEEESSADSNTHSLTPHSPDSHPTVTAESPIISQVEDKHRREMDRKSSPCYQYPLPEAATNNFDASASASAATSAHPEGSFDSDKELATLPNLLGIGNGDMTTGGSNESHHSLLHRTSAASPCSDTSVSCDREVQVAQEPTVQEQFIPVRRVSRGYELDSRATAMNNVRRGSPDNSVMTSHRRGRSPYRFAGHASPGSRGAPDLRYSPSERRRSRSPHRRSRSPSPYYSRQANAQRYGNNARWSPPLQSHESTRPRQDVNTARLGHHSLPSGIPTGPRNSRMSYHAGDVDVPMLGHHKLSTSVGQYHDGHSCTTIEDSHEPIVSFTGRRDNDGGSTIGLPSGQHTLTDRGQRVVQPTAMPFPEAMRQTFDIQVIPTQPAHRTLLDRIHAGNPHRLENEQCDAPTGQHRSYQTNAEDSGVGAYASPHPANETPSLFWRIEEAGDTDFTLDGGYERRSNVAWPNRTSKAQRGFSSSRGNTSRGRFNPSNPTRQYYHNSRGVGRYNARKSWGS